MFVREFMHREIVQIHPEASLLEAAEKMLAHRAETLLILENDRLLGVIGLRDLFTAPIPAHYGNSMLRHQDESQFPNIWKTTRVRNLMNEQALTIKEDETLLRALELMVNSGKHPLPVLRERKVVGIISRMDIVHALVARWKNPA
jgi:CBS-domain-containing membrane protein